MVHTNVGTAKFVKAKGFTHLVTLRTFTTKHVIVEEHICHLHFGMFSVRHPLCGAHKKTATGPLDRYAAKSGNRDYVMTKHFKETHKDKAMIFTAIGIVYVPFTSRF